MIYVDKPREVEDETRLRWTWGAHELLRMDWMGFGKSDPFARFYRYSNTNEHQLVHETEVLIKNLDPLWMEWKTDLSKMCTNHQSFHVEVSDYNKVGGHTLVHIHIIISDWIRQYRHKRHSRAQLEVIQACH